MTKQTSGTDITGRSRRGVKLKTSSCTECPLQPGKQQQSGDISMPLSLPVLALQCLGAWYGFTPSLLNAQAFPEHTNFPLVYSDYDSVRRGCKHKQMFCISEAFVCLHFCWLTHLLSIVNSTSSSSFPWERKWIKSLHVDSSVLKNTLQESVLLRELAPSQCPPLVTAHTTDFIFFVFYLLYFISHTSDVIAIISAGF